jgi:hypothetical protein
LYVDTRLPRGHADKYNANSQAQIGELEPDLSAADVVAAPVRVGERPGRSALGLELDEAEATGVAGAPVAHHRGGAHLAEAGEVGRQVGLPGRGRDAAHEQLARLLSCSGSAMSRCHRRRRARVLGGARALGRERRVAGGRGRVREPS